MNRRSFLRSLGGLALAPALEPITKKYFFFGGIFRPRECLHPQINLVTQHDGTRYTSGRIECACCHQDKSEGWDIRITDQGVSAYTPRLIMPGAHAGDYMTWETGIYAS